MQTDSNQTKQLFVLPSKEKKILEEMTEKHCCREIVSNLTWFLINCIILNKPNGYGLPILAHHPLPIESLPSPLPHWVLTHPPSTIGSLPSPLRRFGLRRSALGPKYQLLYKLLTNSTRHSYLGLDHRWAPDANRDLFPILVTHPNSTTLNQYPIHELFCTYTIPILKT